MSKLVIIRGLPGSGKTTLAKYMAKYTGYPHVEADQYFEQFHLPWSKGEVGNAHKWAQARIAEYFGDGFSHVIVANTFAQLWEIRNYTAFADSFEIFEIEGNWGSLHAPPEVRERMERNWQRIPESWGVSVSVITNYDKMEKPGG